MYKSNWKLDGLQRTAYYYVITVFNFFFLLQIIILSNDQTDYGGRWRSTCNIFKYNTTVYLVNGTMSSAAKEIKV